MSYDRDRSRGDSGQSQPTSRGTATPGKTTLVQAVQRKEVQRQTAPSSDGEQGRSVPTLGNSPQSSRQLSSTEWELQGFATNSDALTPDHEQLIAQIAQDLNANGLGMGGWVTITGQADSRGTDDHNDRLGQQRADRVRARLITLIRDPEVAQQIRAYSIGESLNTAHGDVAAYRQVSVTITRGTLRMPAPQLGLPPAQPGSQPGSPVQPPIDLFPPGALLPPGTGPGGPPTLPPNFWTLPSPQPVPHDFIRELSQWLTGSLGREQIAGIASRIAGAIGMDQAQVRRQLDEAFISAGEEGLKRALRALLEAVAGPPTSPPSSPYGPPTQEVPLPPTLQTPAIPF